MDEYSVSYDFRDYMDKEIGTSGKGCFEQPRQDTGSKDMANGLREWLEYKKNNPSPHPIIENYEEPEPEETLPLYDFGLGKMSTRGDIIAFYGLKIYNRINKEIDQSNNLPDSERKTGQISKKLWQKLRDIRAGKIPNPKTCISEKPKKPKLQVVKDQNSPVKTSKESSPKREKVSKKIEVLKRERQNGDDYFLTIERGIIKNESYLDVFKGPSTVYETLWANIVRKDWHDTEGYPIRKKYHDKQNLLVYCSTYRRLADQCRMSTNTVIRIINTFKEAGIIQTEDFVPEGKKQSQTVFILGWWSGSRKNYTEHLFRDEVFITGKVVKK